MQIIEDVFKATSRESWVEIGIIVFKRVNMPKSSKTPAVIYVENLRYSLPLKYTVNIFIRFSLFLCLHFFFVIENTRYYDIRILWIHF